MRIADPSDSTWSGRWSCRENGSATPGGEPADEHLELEAPRIGHRLGQRRHDECRERARRILEREVAVRNLAVVDDRVAGLLVEPGIADLPLCQRAEVDENEGEEEE